jgi:hypothetical protein
MENTSNNRYYKPSKKFSGNIHRIIFWVIAGTAIAVVFALVFGILVKLLWAATLTPIFNIPPITYWQAVGIVLLARLIFGGFGYRGSRSNYKHYRQDRYDSKSRSFFTKWHDRFHGFSEDDDDADPEQIVPDAYRKYYSDFWEKEGRKAFHEFVSKVNQQTPEKGE